MSSVSQDLSDSAADFGRVVWPAIRPWFGGGDLMPVESVTDSKFTKMLDMCSGIDAWHVSGQNIRGISSRIQWGDPWDTFTVRYTRDSGAKTELEKRREAVYGGRGWLYPHMTVQAYVATPRGAGELLSVAAIETKELIDAASWVVESGKANDGYGIRRTSNASFVWLSWDWLKEFETSIRLQRCKRPHLRLVEKSAAL